MKLLEFFDHYPDEQSCKAAFKARRMQEGVVCKKCGNNAHYWKKKREQWECKKCGYRTTLKSGTVMENSKLSYQYWFIAMHFLTSTKKSFSAKEIQRQLGHNRYEPIWKMLHKIREVMGLRDDCYQLGGEVELDEGFFETVSTTRDKNEQLKRGRGSQRQTIVLVSAASKTVDAPTISQKYNTDKKLGFVKMRIIHSLKMPEITANVKEMISDGSSIISDGCNSYNDLKHNYEHSPKIVKPKDASKILPRVHNAISNAKRLLLDMHHRIDDDFLQNYLNEFVYKL
jgi:transposase-like protein